MPRTTLSLGLAYLALHVVAVLGQPTSTPKQPGTVTLRPVPPLQGLKLESAEQIVRLADLRSAAGVFYLTAQQWREDLKPGTVYLQSPQPKADVPAGSVVVLWTLAKAGASQKIAKTPDLTGLPWAEARQRLGKANLAAFEQPAPSTEQVVIEQYPRPGQAVVEKTSVWLRFGQKSVVSRQ